MSITTVGSSQHSLSSCDVVQHAGLQQAVGAARCNDEENAVAGIYQTRLKQG